MIIVEVGAVIGWLAGRYFVKETERVVAIVREMPPAPRRQVMAHLADKIGLVADVEAKGGSAFYMAVKQIAEEATRQRQQAVSFGVLSFSDPKWCAPALVEQWATAWIAMKQGRISRARFERIDAILWELMNEVLTPEAILKATHQSAPKLFINYRREDSAGDARSLFGALTRHFGDDNVFLDVSSISAGERFEETLRLALRESAAFIAVIGPDWHRLLLERQDRHEVDYVFLEIEAALHQDLVVVPVFLSRAGKMHALPRSESLPSSLIGLFSSQMQVVSHERFERDVEELVHAIRKQLRERASQRLAKGPHQAYPSDNDPRARTRGMVLQQLSAKDLTLRLNTALKRFVEIDEDVWNTSLRRMFGLSRIPFDTHRRTLSELVSELQTLLATAQSREGQGYAIFAAYTDRLRTAVLLLESICAGLELKANAKKGPGWAEYNAMVDQYAEAKNAYSALGPELNRFARDAPMIDRRERG